MRTRRESQGILVRGRNASTLIAVGIKRARERERETRANFDRTRRQIKESGGGWECADPSGGRSCEIASAKYKEREKEMERGKEWKKGERRTLLGK